MTIVAARELQRFGVRVNAIAPSARTRLTEGSLCTAELVRPAEDPNAFDRWDPANTSPLVAFMAAADCPISGQLFRVGGGRLTLDTGWRVAERYAKDGRWEIEELRAALADVPTAPPPLSLD
jgi:NAD(P)-dependent dehydrogenase (short-subunit alcohol dehydrogenase family)